jgi:uncharacterized protein
MVFILATTTGLVSAQDGVSFPDKPPRQHFWVDEVRLLRPEDAAEIDRIAGELLRSEKVPLVVVTIRSLASYGAEDWGIERYARELFDHWGIGSERRNYGMLLLVSAGDRRARIELGVAWGTRHNVAAYEVMDRLIIPSFKRGDFSTGILDGVRGLDAMARDLALPRPKTAWWQPVLFFGLIALGIGVAISLIKSGRRGWGWALLAALGVVLFFALRSAMSRSGSGGSFGGGFSGGGGATGSW